MKDLGEASRILGMDVSRRIAEGEIFISQSSYCKKSYKKI